nr:PREDICTED: uncharacterized protein LOC105663396 isoform X1 [Megachile rotundata]
MIYEQWDIKRSMHTKSEQTHAKPQVTNEQVSKDIRKPIEPFRKRYSFTLNLSYNIPAILISHRLRQPMHKRRISGLSLKSHHRRASVVNARKNSNVLRSVKNLSQNNVEDLILNNESKEIQLFPTDPTKIAPSVSDQNKVVEIWNSRKQRSNRLRNKRLDVTRNNGSIEPQRKALKKLITFEAWKRSKSIEHRKLMRQLEEERERKATEVAEEAKKKKAIRQVRMRYRKRQRKLTQIPKCNRTKNKCDIKRDVTSSKERKCIKFDKGKTATLSTIRKSNNVNKSKKQLALMQNSLENVIFCSWLDQLNWILHKKYLRERRHLVQSFYCQPVYYGDATLYVR